MKRDLVRGLSLLFCMSVVLATGIFTAPECRAAVPCNAFIADDVKSSDFQFRVRVGNNPLSVAVRSDLLIDGLSAGQTFLYIPDGLGGFLPPALSTVQEMDIPAEIRVHGDANAAVLVTFALPQVLYPQSGTGIVRLDFNGMSAVWGSPGTAYRYFNPLLPEEVNLNQDGDCDISLGCIATVSPDATADDYEAEAIVTVAYVVN